MKILSTGDWHLGAGYDDDVVSSVNQIIEHALDGIDLIAITGDIFHCKSDPAMRNKADRLVQGLSECAHVIIARGNHDHIGDLLGFANLKSKHQIQVFEEPAFFSYPVLNTVVHVLPWVTKAMWQSLHPEVSMEEGDKTVSQAVLNYLRNQILLTDDGEEDKVRHVLIGHLLIAGAKAQNHQPLLGEGVTLGVYDLPDAGFSAALLGHIHLVQEFAPGFLYNGSVAALNYGEEPDKYFSVLDTEANSVQWIELDTIDRFSFDAEWDELESAWNATSAFDPKRVSGARVRVNLRVNQGANVEFAKSIVGGQLVELNAAEVKINVQSIPKELVRASEVSKSKTNKEKLENFWKVTQAPPEETQKDSLLKLEELEAELNETS